MTALRSFQSLPRLLLTGVVVAGALFTPNDATPSISGDQVPPAERQAIEALLNARVGSLMSEKNSDGVPFKRGTWSPAFRKINATTYQTTFHLDTASADRLITERQLLTVKKDAAGRWSVASAEKKDTYDALIRGLPGDEKFLAFDKVAFDHEGLKLTGGPGFAVKDFLGGEPTRYIFVADGLAYDYLPPKDLDYYQIHKQVLLKKLPEEFLFTPAWVWIECSPPSCRELEASTFTGLREVPVTSISPKLSKLYQERIQDYVDLLKGNAFAGFRLPFESDRKTFNVSIRRESGTAHSVWLDVDSYEPREVTFGASSRGPVFSYNSDETRKAGLDPAEIERRDDVDARNYELHSLKGSVELAVEDAEAVSGDLTYGITIKRPLRELPFQISRLRFSGSADQDTKNPRMFVHSVTDGDGNELTWVKVGASGGVIVFPQQATAGQKLTVHLQFESKDSIYKLNPSYSYVDRGGWLPLVRFGDMIPEFDLTVKVPEKYTTLGVGKKVSESRAGGISTTRWIADSPVTFPTVIFGEYIQDKSGIKATKINGTEIPVNVYVDKVSTYSVSSMAGGSEIRGSQLRSLADQAANALNLYREVYGVDYPYSKLDLVNAPFDQGAQAPASIIYLGSFLFRGEGTLASGGGRKADYMAKFIKDTVAHETAHQWWGSLICMANFRNYWFVESLAEFSSALYVEGVYGKKKYLEKVAEWRRSYLEHSPIGSVQNSPSTWAGDFAEDGRSYVSNVYEKGPYAFYTLRETFGDDKFFAFLKSLAKELQGKEIVTRDIQRVAETSFGGNMDWFFDQWIRGVGIPQFAITYNVRKTEDGKFLVEGKIRQRIVVGPDKVELPGALYRGLGKITFIFHNGKEFTYPKPLLVEKAETPFTLKIPEEPAEVAFNKSGEILAHDVLVNQSW